MKKYKTKLRRGTMLLTLFVLWTLLIQTVDVQPAGETAMEVGFSTLNLWFHKLTDVHMTLYHITDWLGLIPVFICLLFGLVGLYQLITRKSLFKVDVDLILLGVYYVVVISLYLIFEMLPINYRPVFIEGRLEASYPSSTTLLVLSVMPTLYDQAKRKIRNSRIQTVICTSSAIFSLFMVIGRMISGVHWLTDIAGSVLLSLGLFLIYKAFVLLCGKE